MVGYCVLFGCVCVGCVWCVCCGVVVGVWCVGVGLVWWCGGCGCCGVGVVFVICFVGCYYDDLDDLGECCLDDCVVCGGGFVWYGFVGCVVSKLVVVVFNFV